MAPLWVRREVVIKYSIAVLTLMVSILSLPGCFRDATVTGLPVAKEPALEDWRNHFLFGVVRGIRTDDVDLDKVCPEGVARIETKQNGWNGLVTVLTLGIYTPQKLNVYCVAIPDAAPVETESQPAEPSTEEVEPGDQPPEQSAPADPA